MGGERSVVPEMSTEPLFSVVIPTLGRESLKRAVDSVLGQSFEGFELIVVVDGADCCAEEQLREIADPRLRVIARSSGGVSAARNAGIMAARGEWVAFLDDDDEALAHWLGTWHSIIDPETWVVTGTIRFVTSDSQRSEEVVCRIDPGDRTMRAGHLLAGGFAVRRDFLLRIEGYDERLRYSENTDLGLRLCDALAAVDDSPGLVRHTPETVVDVMVEFGHTRVAKYRAAHGEAAELLLGKHSKRLAADPVARAALLRVVSNACRHSGDRGGAVTSAWSACRSDWRGRRNWRVLVAALVPWLEEPVRRALHVLRTARN